MDGLFLLAALGLIVAGLLTPTVPAGPSRWTLVTLRRFYV